MAPVDDLQDLRNRLQTGVADAARRSVDENWNFDIRVIDGVDLRSPLATLYTTRTEWLKPDTAKQAIEAIATYLAARRSALMAVLLAPHELLDRIPEIGGQKLPDLADHWLGMTWIAEGAWQAASGPLTGPGFAPGDSELLHPLAARLRFLVLTEPMRHRAQTGNPWLPAAIPGRPPHGIYTIVFGQSTWNTLVGRCREARRTWLSCLNSYQSHPYLATAAPRKLEAEIIALTLRTRWKPLGLSMRPLAEPAPPTAEDEAIIADIISKHLLPRFSLPTVAKTAAWAAKPWHSAARITVAAAVVSTALVAFVAAGMLHVRLGTVFATISYTLLGTGTVAFGGRWAAMWLLRLPAAAAIGVFTLISFLPTSWLTAPVNGPGQATAALAVAAYGYLAIEVRNHSVGWFTAIYRSAAIAVAGVAHAALVTLLGLVAIGPAFAAGLGNIWRNPGGYQHAGKILLISTAWCLAAGVFSQILWDDRPITAPLAHMDWRG